MPQPESLNSTVEVKVGDLTMPVGFLCSLVGEGLEPVSHQTLQNDGHSIAVALQPNFWGADPRTTYNNPMYYSGSNPAYREGYDPAIRLEKYRETMRRLAQLIGVRRELTRGTVVDCGGGLGYFSMGLFQELVKRGLVNSGDVSRFRNLDISSQQDDVVATMGVGKDTNDLSDMPYPDESVSLATSFHVFEHLPLTEVKRVIPELWRVLARRGLCYFTIPTLDGRIQEDPTLRKQILLDPTHLTHGTRRWWEAQFKNQGFGINTNLQHYFDHRQYGWVFILEKN